MKARVRAETVLIECPKCSSIISAPSYSHFWTVHELRPIVHCETCKRQLNIPKQYLATT